ncbi:MAG: YlmH/Sll1252 family protein [Peptoniphilaceae bacterium]|nr:YlmH/Sll1252 family protein [Peptoniphilaceae bacterium]
MTIHFRELADRSRQRGIGIDTDFLTPEEYREYLAIAPSLQYADPCVYEEEWERKLVHFGPGKAQFSVLRMDSLAGDYVHLSHRDYLGALLGLGLERRVIGDIFVQDAHAFLLIKSSMAEFVLNTLQQVGRAGVRTCLVDELPIRDLIRIQKEEIVVSSLRLDRFLSTSFRVSRSQAQNDIRTGLVQVDGAEETRVHATLVNDQRISYRRHGKIRFYQVLRNTKGGSLVLSIGRYQ